MLQIESDGEHLGPVRKDGGDRFPSHDNDSWDNRILEEKAESKKHSAVADTSEGRHQEIGPQLSEARHVKDIRCARRTKTAIHEVEASKDGCFEEHDGNDRAGKKLSYDQDFSSYGHEKLIMKSAFNHFAAKYPRKDGHTSKEDAQPEIVELHYFRKDLCIGPDLVV